MKKDTTPEPQHIDTQDVTASDKTIVYVYNFGNLTFGDNNGAQIVGDNNVGNGQNIADVYNNSRVVIDSPNNGETQSIGNDTSSELVSLVRIIQEQNKVIEELRGIVEEIRKELKTQKKGK